MRFPKPRIGSLHLRKSKLFSCVVLVASFLLVLDFSGAWSHLWELDYDTRFVYPLDIDLRPLVSSLRKGQKPSVEPILTFDYKYLKTTDRCGTSDTAPLRLVYVIKSAMDHFERRNVIRETWAYEKRFSDVRIRRIFVLGISTEDQELQRQIDRESETHGDIVQADFVDAYSNNTIKTMVSIKWMVEHCLNTEFVVFADDDMYLSTKNILRFLRDPCGYPAESVDEMKIQSQNEDTDKLYAGYVFHSPPLRHKFSKWYVSLEEYPFTLWPPYATAGAYVVSRNALLDLYYGSMYTKLFRFDDVYLGLVARKVHLDPLHCSEFYFWKKPYSPAAYKNVIASHGYGDPEELRRIWQEQKTLGNA